MGRRQLEQVAAVMAYYDSTEWQDQPEPAGDPEHRAELRANIAAAAIGADRDLLELVVREACRRARGADLIKVCDQHRRHAESAAQGVAELAGELTSIEPARWRRDHRDDDES